MHFVTQFAMWLGGRIVLWILDTGDCAIRRHKVVGLIPMSTAYL